jgi:hypothetical protein
MCTLLLRTKVHVHSLLHDSVFVCVVLKRCFPIFFLHAMQNASSHPLFMHADVNHQSPLLVHCLCRSLLTLLCILAVVAELNSGVP